MENGGGKRKSKGRRWRKQRKNKRGQEERKAARETKQPPRLLFIEFTKILFGINLNNLDATYLYDHAAAAAASASPDIEPPPLLPTSCRLNLPEDLFLSRGMRHIKIKSHDDNDDEVYLVGREVHEEKSAYSDKVYKFDYRKIHCHDDNYDTKQVLIPLPNSNTTTTPLNPTLYAIPEISLVANLNGTFYFLNHWESFHHQVPHIALTTFNRFDPITHSFHQEPVPHDFSPSIESHFVVDNKLVIVSDWLYIFDADANPPAWTCSSSALFSNSFLCRYSPYNDAPLESVPEKLFWISDFGFCSSSSCSLFDSLTVFLAIRLVRCDSFDPEVHRIPDEEEVPFHMSFCYNCTLQVHAYALSKSDYELHFYQKLDDVFADLLPLPFYTPLNLFTKNYLFLDLGKGGGGEDGKQEGLRRICLIMTVEGLRNRILYLFVSIFDLRMKPGPYLKQEKNCNDYDYFDKRLILNCGDEIMMDKIMLDAAADAGVDIVDLVDDDDDDVDDDDDDDSWPFLDEFLEVVCVKKRVFRLNQCIDEEYCPSRQAWPLPPLDAFII